MSLKEECKRLFNTDDLYEVLRLQKGEDLNEAKIKKAYYKCSLLYHPDKAPESGEKSEATEKFQILSKVYTILVDKDKREVYDTTGDVGGEDLVFDSNFDWYAFWRNLYKFNSDDIKTFEDKYKGSDEEKEDLKKFYIDGEGSLDYILDNLMCATYDDEDRLVKIIKDMISAGEIEDLPSFSKEPAKKKKARKMRAEKEAKEAAKVASTMSNGNGQASLEETIKKNAEARNADLINNLEEKYGDKSKAEVAKKGSRGRPKKAASEEPKISEVADKPTVEVKSDVEETSAQAEVPAKKGRGRPGKKAVEDKVEEAIEPRSSEEPTTVETTASAAVEPTEDKQDPIEIEVDNNPATAPPKKAGRPPKGAKKVEKTTEDKSDADSDVAAGRKTRGVLGSPKKAAESESDEPEVPAKRGRPARGAATAAKELMKTAAADEAAEEKPGRKTRGAAGSPKKSAEAEKPEEAVVPAKKGRGRPPAAAKHQEESADEGTSVEAEPKEKGKRGRPKKQ